ncbi:hypothetical protein, partial [Planotetraspora phitsanulokensis]
PLKDWKQPRYRALVSQYADYVAIKQRGKQDGWVSEAIHDVVPRGQRVWWSAEYIVIPREYLQAVIDRLGGDSQVIIRAVQDGPVKRVRHFFPGYIGPWNRWHDVDHLWVLCGLCRQWHDRHMDAFIVPGATFKAVCHEMGAEYEVIVRGEPYSLDWKTGSSKASEIYRTSPAAAPTRLWDEAVRDLLRDDT